METGDVANKKVIPMESPDNRSARKKRILVVEDEERIALLLKNRLQAAGYDVGRVARGDDALRMTRLTSPDLILLDVMLPEMNGFVICRLLKFDRRFQHIPIVMLTALQSTADIQEGEVVHADVYLTKPFNDEVLLHVIKDQLKNNSKKKPGPETPPSPVWIDGMMVLGPD